MGWQAEPRGDTWFVTGVEKEGPAAGKLQAGDQILLLNGSSRLAQFGVTRELIADCSATSYAVDAVRQGRAIHQVLSFWRRPDEARTNYVYLFLALLNLAVAIWIGASRPDYPTAQVAFFLFLAIARTFSSSVLQSFPPHWTAETAVLTLLFGSSVWRPLEWAVAYDFALRFPQPLPQPGFFLYLRTLFYSAGVALWLAGILPLLAYVFGMPLRSSLLPRWFPLGLFDTWNTGLADVLGAAALLLVPFLLWRNYRRLPDALARRRVRWAALGISLTAIPIALEVSLRLAERALGRHGASASEGILDNTASFFSALAPLTLAYAIVKHRVLGIRLVIRRGVQYLLARNVLRFILWLPLIAIAVSILLHPTEQLRDFLLHRSLWFYMLVASSALISLRYRGRMQLWVDRKFFRSAYEEETFLSELIDRLQCCEDPGEVARVLAEKLQESLQPTTISVLYRKEPGQVFTVGHPHGSAAALQFRGILNERVQDILQSQRSARTFTEISAALEEKETASSPLLAKALLAPISGAGGTLLGVVLLDEKKSEQPYSNRDRRLLQAVTAQAGFVLEMLALKEQVQEEGRVRVEVLGRLEHERIQLVLECALCGRCFNGPTSRCDKDGSALGLTLPIERVIEGKYKLERRIGTGGMGAVYQALDLRLDRLVAVKVMTGRLFGNNAALRRFEREARAAARLEHPNIVAVYDFGPLRGGGAYLVMPRIEGRSWRAEMARSGPIQPRRAAIWFDQLCDAMVCAHSSGVIHRDLKPENILISSDEDGRDKATVLDFGIAKVFADDRSPEQDLTSVDRVLGTHGYMSPEQRNGETIDSRTDVYALGVIAVETLSGSRPPPAGASHEWLDESLRWPQDTAASAELAALLRQALEDRLVERIQSIREFGRQLIPLLKDCPPLLAARRVTANGEDTQTMSS